MGTSKNTNHIDKITFFGNCKVGLFTPRLFPNTVQILKVWCTVCTVFRKVNAQLLLCILATIIEVLCRMWTDHYFTHSPLLAVLLRYGKSTEEWQSLLSTLSHNFYKYFLFEGFYVVYLIITVYFLSTLLEKFIQTGCRQDCCHPLFTVNSICYLPRMEDSILFCGTCFCDLTSVKIIQYKLFKIQSSLQKRN